MDIFFYFLTSIYNMIVVINIVFILVVLFSKKSPTKIFSWLLVLYFVPLIGFVLYLFLGINWRKRSIVNRLTISDHLVFADQEETRNKQKLVLKSPEARQMKSLINIASVTTRLPASTNNEIRVIHDTTEAFEAICQDVERAQHHVHIEFYVFQPDETGQSCKEMLIKKANENVKIKMIIDAVGSERGIRTHFFRELIDHPNIEISFFQPVKFPIINLKANYRNHRKLVVVDGKIGYLGGMNIGNEYLGKSERFGYWRDTMIRLAGQSVYNIQTVFIQDWHFVRREKLPRSKEYFPPLSPKEGHHLVQIVPSSPHANWDVIAQLYFESIASARTSLYITTPYFIPDETLMMALKTAALGGTDVKILVPGKPDRRLRLSFLATSSYLEDAVAAGIEVYLYHPSRFIHSKVITVDGVFASIGSANVDQRSMNINFEMNALIYDKAVVKDINDAFFNDLKYSVRLTIQDIKRKSVIKLIAESLARLLSPIL